MSEAENSSSGHSKAQNEKDKPKEMTRGTQTAIIVAVLIGMGLVALYVATRLPSSDPRSQCQTLFGFDNECLVWGPGGFRG